MNSNDKLRDEYIAHSIWVARYGTGAAKRMIDILNESDAELQARLVVAMDGMNASNFTVTRLESLLGSVREVNASALDKMTKALLSEMDSFAGVVADAQESMFRSAIPGGVFDTHPLVGITQDQVYAAAVAQPFQGRLLKEWMSGLEEDRITRIVNSVRQGFLAGDTVLQVAAKVRGHANQGYKDGAMQLSRSNAGTLTKTALGHTAAIARSSFAESNDDLLKGKQWLSTLDNKTSPECRIRDHLKYTMQNKPIGHKIPYLQGPGRLHMNCRSTETLILKSAKELGIPAADLTPSARASMDGVVAGDTTYADWFNRQSYARQSQIVGPVRAKLLRDNGMSPDELYTDKGEWLTLAQLRDRIPSAFADADIN